jgi:hypothetical protein
MKRQWPILRTLLFIIIGLFNTVFIRHEDVGTWKNYLGYVLLIIGIADAVSHIVKYIKTKT